jgi:hypothetical protein
LTLFDPKVKELALKVQYGTEATKAMVPSSFGGQWEPATFRPPLIWYAGLFYESQWYADRGYYQLEEVPGINRIAIPNDDDNWEFRQAAMFNKKDWVWEASDITAGQEYRAVYVLLFDAPGSLTSWEFIKLSTIIKVSKGKVVRIPSGNIKIIPDTVLEKKF